ncbi:UDP-N-acetylglucosamine 1-carboxyvinyltransferase [Patescibacteria group bacterium]|jgi:UDP-N-acetylglucosamine 1-carboxyvinyltransferase|nr:UDP-N-acetylglucosamine 1-carboxyvinyltransferase [Patescibacteria group bacterium]HPD07639.1 UDP-N-acetylglucosamine 1-carboxyvinyltransferase [bacterium]HRT10954.1 UDP-N-acetylglucosamine 1-carboxyvinyltransferase [Patescibacteria group bacterium]HRU89805.1 UDP-N-acetylglucosamine 1-carboxyvinyltransferase [Patescibacteria group bacterium]
MSKFIIQGQAPLKGQIKVNGAKNSALKIIPASLLSEESITINNLPDIEDINRSLEIIKAIGGQINRQDPHQCSICTKNIHSTSIPSELANKFRASIMFVGPILARSGEVSFPHPGGCVIGAGIRPIDLFLEGFAALGATIHITNNYYHLSAKKLKGAEYFFTTVSVTGTEALMMTATLAQGQTTLKNCAMEPEIVALADYLNAQGAKISGAGTPTITIEGTNYIRGGHFTVIPDRIEAGTFAILAAVSQAELLITNCNPDHIAILLNIFHKIGVHFEQGQDWLKILPSPKITAYNIKTHEYPGFPTDLQSPYTVLMTQAHGLSIIHETIYDRRLLFTDMLTQMGANIIMCDPHRVVVNGPTPLHGRKLTSPDLRAGMAMVIAALIADGTTEIDNIYQIERGYEAIAERLQTIGANIHKID